MADVLRLVGIRFRHYQISPETPEDANKPEKQAWSRQTATVYPLTFAVFGFATSWRLRQVLTEIGPALCLGSYPNPWGKFLWTDSVRSESQCIINVENCLIKADSRYPPLKLFMEAVWGTLWPEMQPALV